MKRLWKTWAILGLLAFVPMVTGCAQSGNIQKPADNQSSPKQSQPLGQESQNQPPASNAATASKNKKYKSPPEVKIDPKKQYFATVKTNRGQFKIKLLAAEAPVTVNNFVFLAKDGYYDGIRFHRIMKGFMIQTGDPLGNGTGGPGYTFADELPPKLPYGPGVVAMANAGPNTNGSQFFICNGEQSKVLNGSPNYTVFGQIVEGMDVVLKISDTPVERDARGEPSKPAEEVIMEKVTIEEK